MCGALLEKVSYLIGTGSHPSFGEASAKEVAMKYHGARPVFTAADTMAAIGSGLPHP